MFMIPRYVPSDDLDIPGSADLPDQLPQPNRYWALQHWLAVFRDPYKVIL